MDEIRMEVNIIPTKATHQSALRVMRKSNGQMFIGKFAKSSVKSWIQEFNWKIKQYKPAEPLNGPLELQLHFKFPWNKTTPKKYLNKEEWKITRPDLDNMEKMILDSLTSEGFIVDDSLICLKTTSKKHSNNHGINIVIRQICP